MNNYSKGELVFTLCSPIKKRWNVKIADMDAKQGTCTRWNMVRNASNIEPIIKVEQYRSIKDAINDYKKII